MIINSLLNSEQIGMALAIMAGFSGYLRPRTLMSLDVSMLIPPHPFGGAYYLHWQSDSSMKRYRQASRAQAELAKLSKSQLLLGQALDKDPGARRRSARSANSCSYPSSFRTPVRQIEAEFAAD